MGTVRWSFGSGSANNRNALMMIGDWLRGLEGTTVIVRQRDVAFGEDPNWANRTGDRYLQMGKAEIRGTTVYFVDLEDLKERGVLASTMELDSASGACTIASGRVNGRVLRIEQTALQRTIDLGSASYALEGNTLIVSDKQRGLRVKMPFGPAVASLLLPYFEQHGALGLEGFRPGQTCPTSGQWEILEPILIRTGKERTVVKNEPFPPLQFEGGAFRLVDATKH